MTSDIQQIKQPTAANAISKPVEFPVVDTQIENYKKRYMGLTIGGPEDKAGYDLVHSARMVLRNARTSVEAKRKELVEGAVKYQRTVNDEAKRITALISPIEKHLQGMEDDYECQREAIRKRKEAEAQQRIEGFFHRLREIGFVWDSTSQTQYQRIPGGVYSISFDRLKSITDAEFDSFFKDAKMAYDEDQQRLQQIERERQIEADRIAAVARQQEAERQKLEAERAQLKRQQDELIAQQQKLRFDNRVTVLLGLGYVKSTQFDGYAFEDTHLRVQSTGLMSINDADFEWLLKDHEKEVKRLEEEDRKRQDVILAAQQQARIDEQNRIKAEAEAKAERERKEKARAERRARLAPDKDKLLILATSYSLVPEPELKSDEARQILTVFLQNITAAITAMKREASAL